MSWKIAVFTALGYLLSGPPALAGAPLDVILEGGTVFSGDGRAGVVTDVGIAGDRIAAVGDLSERSSATRIDVAGLAVTPGFVDIHSHAVRDTADTSGIFLWPDAESYIRQGVTTAIGGPDGSSWYPLAELFGMLEKSPSAINFGTFVGHNTVRQLAMGRADRAPTPGELQTMKSLVEVAMNDGAFGLSSGLKYIPGAYAETGEVIALARVAAAYGGIYISHMREEGVGLLDSVRETIRIGQAGGLPAQITHHKAMGARTWGQSEQSLALVDEANARGLDISIDQYPYAASSTGIDVLFPAWSLAGDRETRLARLHDPEVRARIKAGIIDNLVNDRGGNDPSRVALADCRWDQSLNGLDLAEILRRRGLEADMPNAAELVMELEEKGGCSAVYHSMDEADVVRIMQHPKTMVASDGGIHMPANDRPHPRNYGSFARVLGRYVREQGVLGFADAVYRMSRMPADRIGLPDRGRIATGAYADIAVLDPDAVIDRATFSNPHQLAAGVRHVFVNGQAVLRDGEMTGSRPGRVLQRGGRTYGLGLPRDLSTLAVPDEHYPRWPLTGAQQAYAGVSGARMKQWVRAISAISLQSLADGNPYWGRLPGTPYDRMTMDLMAAEFERLGLETERIPVTIPDDWTPSRWQASYAFGELRIGLESAFPVGETAATPAGGITAEAVWVGIGAEPDFLGRDVRGKAVVIYSTFVPGGRSHSASSRAGIFDANRRASERGAALIVNVMAVPGNAQFNPLGAPAAEFGVPLITVSQDEGFRLRDLLGAGAKIDISLELDITIRKNVETANLVARLPGASKEEIVLAAHTDGFFQGAMDNAAGLASALEIARFHAAIPRQQRPRSLVFFLFPDHHHGEVGLRAFEQNYDWENVAMALTLEHPSQTQLYWYNDDLMTSNAVGAFRWNALGSDRFVRLVTDTLREFGVSIYTGMNPKPKLTRRAPGFHIIDHVIYHTTLDIPELVPAEGLERSTRAFLSIIDRVNEMSLEELRAP
jgi:dihydroorotase/N-acyl-D-amino-acid deacylase